MLYDCLCVYWLKAPLSDLRLLTEVKSHDHADIALRLQLLTIVFFSLPVVKKIYNGGINRFSFNNGH